MRNAFSQWATFHRALGLQAGSERGEGRPASFRQRSRTGPAARPGTSWRWTATSTISEAPAMPQGRRADPRSARRSRGTRRQSVRRPVRQAGPGGDPRRPAPGWFPISSAPKGLIWTPGFRPRLREALERDRSAARADNARELAAGHPAPLPPGQGPRQTRGRPGEAPLERHNVRRAEHEDVRDDRAVEGRGGEGDRRDVRRPAVVGGEERAVPGGEGAANGQQPDGSACPPHVQALPIRNLGAQSPATADDLTSAFFAPLTA